MGRHLPPWRAPNARLEPDAREELAGAVAAELERANRATDGTLVVPGE